MGYDTPRQYLGCRRYVFGNRDCFHALDLERGRDGPSRIRLRSRRQCRQRFRRLQLLPPWRSRSREELSNSTSLFAVVFGSRGSVPGYLLLVFPVQGAGFSVPRSEYFFETTLQEAVIS